MKTDEDAWRRLAPVAASISNLVSQPVVVMDLERRIRLINAPMEALLGVCRTAVMGKTFEQVCASADPEAVVRAEVTEAFAGARCGGETSAVHSNGTILSLSWECTLVPGPVPAVVAVVRSSRERHVLEAPLFAGDMRYEISTQPTTFGVIHEVWAPRLDVREFIGKRCYTAIGRRNTMCPECPVRRSGDATQSIVPAPHSKGGFNIVTVEKTRSTTARLGSRLISATVLNDLFVARVNDLASRRRLSPREHQVLRALVDGRSQEDIALELGITPRTVKFHQANLLGKLGADSRADLLRLLF